MPPDPEHVAAERDALREDLRSAHAELAVLGNRIWELEHELLKLRGKQLTLSGEGMR